MNLADAIKALQEEHMALTKQGDSKPERWDALEAKYNHFLNKFPDHPEILFQAGTFYLQRDKRAIAIALIERCVAKGAGGAGPWLNIAAAYKQGHKIGRAHV